ncbi:kinase-like domain-containing protein [Jimgerdemannia flammicorona]|uniref:Kinase-like domain-containing protein n=1 Tax=Jimgerdemannia flammicorona TaxID=994334 RepID=A0A433CX91_9FUNG|nr:kinase-like domain-containing protein [Jimgerdemannia flammicorona]
MDDSDHNIVITQAIKSSSSCSSSSSSNCAVPHDKPPHSASPRVPWLAADSVIRGDRIGHGGFCSVFRGTLGGATVAIKHMSAPSLAREELEKTVQNELSLLGRLRHSNFITQVLGYYQHNDMVCIVMAFAENGDLQRFLRAGRLKDYWSTKARICADVAKAVDSVHAERIVHGDLKASNILLDRFLTPKLGDFGVSKTFTSVARGSQLGSTLRYIAPERLRMKPSYKFSHEESMLSDIYAYGLIMWEVATDGKLPYHELEDKESLVVAKVHPGDQLEYVGSLPDDVPGVFRDTIQLCLSCDPSLRPSLASIQDALDAYIATAPPSSVFPISSLQTAQTTSPPASTNNPMWLPLADADSLRADVSDDETRVLTGSQKDIFGIGWFYFEEKMLMKAVEQFENPELRNHPLAQRILGHCHIAAGDDPVNVFKCFKRSAEGGDPKGQFNLAWCFDHRYGTRQDLSSAFQWYTASAAAGNVEAAKVLRETRWSKHVEAAIGAPDASGSTLDWLRNVFAPGISDALADRIMESARSGDAHAQGFFALLYYLSFVILGDNVGEHAETPSVAELFIWLVKFGIGGNKLAQCEVRKLLVPRPQPDVSRYFAEAFRLLSEEAELLEAPGLLFCQCQVGICYGLGIGVARDETMAFRWNYAAAKAGDTVAQCNLSNQYLWGAGTDEDRQEAFRWCLKAASAGDTSGQTKLATMYIHGTGTKVDYDLALQWCTAAAEAGDANAQLQLGDIYSSDPRDGFANPREAFVWWSKAAETGLASAQLQLGIAYDEGLGAEPDKENAAQYFLKVDRQRRWSGSASATGTGGGWRRMRRRRSCGSSGRRTSRRWRHFITLRCATVTGLVRSGIWSWGRSGCLRLGAMYLIGQSYKDDTGGFGLDVEKAREWMGNAGEFDMNEASDELEKPPVGKFPSARFTWCGFFSRRK